jgi:hypothetical protein
MKMKDSSPKKLPESNQKIYQIRVRGHLGEEWAEWFDGLEIRIEESGETLLTGPVIDQAALFGVLKKVQALGLVLISVNDFPPRPNH